MLGAPEALALSEAELEPTFAATQIPIPTTNVAQSESEITVAEGRPRAGAQSSIALEPRASMGTWFSLVVASMSEGSPAQPAAQGGGGPTSPGELGAGS